MNLDLKNKVAIISGGTKGIGLAISEGLAKEGVKIILCARNEARLKESVNTITEKYKVEAIGIKTDLTNIDKIKNFIIKVKKAFNKIDILINNAGMGSEGKIADAPDDRWQYYWDLHLMAAVRLSRELLPLMRKSDSGVIINNASLCAKQPLGYEPIYNVTKAALVMLSKCMSEEYINYNIRVNCVNPGYTLTPDWKRTAGILGEKEGITWEEYIGRIAKDNIPINRFATVEEIANFFVFLCSPRASYCVGSTFYIDGGALKVVT